MAKNDLRQYSVLIVSGAEQFNTIAMGALPGNRFSVKEIKKSASMARRELLERDYDIVIIQTPLPDELGIELAIDASVKNSALCLLVTPGEIFEEAVDNLVDYGVFVMAKPVDKMRLSRGIKHLLVVRDMIEEERRKAAKLEEKLAEEKLVSRAKCLLIERKHMTEEEAHRYIGKQAMDRSLSRKRMAMEIIDRLE